MIKVVVVSNSSTHIELLAQFSDISSVHVIPDTIDQVIEEVGLASPDITVIEDATDSMTADMLCYELSQFFPETRSIILIDGQPTFDMLQNSGFKARGYLTLDQWLALPDGEAWLPRKLVAEMLNRFASST
jgi:DNA-binding NarL/FixJ family response regulator